MAIAPELLKATNGRGLAICTYGTAGTRKTLAIATLPAPVLVLDFEGGAGTLNPWIRTILSWSTMEPVTFSQQERLEVFERLDPHIRSLLPLPPGPYCDVISFDTLEPASWNTFMKVLGNFEHSYYRSLAIDSLQAFSVETQTLSKAMGINPKDISAVTREIIAQTPMSGQLWSPAQSYAQSVLNLITSIKNRGVMVYLTAGENIDKDYVTDPRSQTRDTKELPYSILGSVLMPGKMANEVVHAVDLLMHAKPHTRYQDGATVNNSIWVTRPEPLIGGSGAYWVAKDRYGRLPPVVEPNFVAILKTIYGEAAARAIYNIQIREEAHAGQPTG
jgi:hypothetical protein